MITGVSDFIGSNFAKRILTEGVVAYALDARDRKEATVASGKEKNVTLTLPSREYRHYSWSSNV